MIYDMHCHLYEFSNEEIENILEKEKDLRIVAVSDDLTSLKRTIELQELYPERVVACAGFHPWKIGKVSLAELDDILRIIYRRDILCIGEVGLDKKFVPETIDLQYKVFRRFLEVAQDLETMLNIHSPNAWKDVLSLLKEFEIKKAMFHWYTGPLNLIETIGGMNYKISINAAVLIQKKHQEVVKKAPLEYIVLESDGPYEYKGLRLTPLIIKRTAEEIAKIKSINVDEVLKFALDNSLKLLNFHR